MQYSIFHIHGDNIVECERTFELIKTALSDKTIKISGPIGNPVCPVYNIYLSERNTLNIIFYPGFGRWNDDINQFVRECGGILREAADVIITGVREKTETPLLAMEYCGALPAGNQAWQRSGRAFSFGLAHIPYLYIAEIGGYELDKSRNRKSPRMPNPAIPFSYISFSLKHDTPVLPVFVTSLGADEESRRTHSDEFSEDELISLIRCILVGENNQHILEIIRQKVLAFVQKRAGISRKGRTLSPKQWNDAYDMLKQGKSLVDFIIEKAPLSWSKKAYIDNLTNTAKKLMSIASKFAVGLTSADLPMCIIPGDKRKIFASEISNMYNNISPEFDKWINSTEHLVICWIMGFKPRGDDARPDRGLPPMTRMLVGNEHDLLSVVYGPAPTSTWEMLLHQSATLAQRNGLWEAIFAVSDALLIDSATDNITRHGFVREHWEKDIQKRIKRDIFITPLPERVGENDVDTVLHNLLARHAGDNVYEGMCNPPGGDWSGVSLQPPDRSIELRWLSLPRVSGIDTKRPDHVFQLFNIASRPIIFSIESKETANSVENNIGHRLSSYIKNLISSEASIERTNPSLQCWYHSSRKLDISDFIFASGAAFISNSASQIDTVLKKAGADVIFAYTFNAKGKSCDIRLIPNGKTGNIICTYIYSINLQGTGITLSL